MSKALKIINIACSVFAFMLVTVSSDHGLADDRPKILSESDVRLYQEIFALQEAGRMGEADKRISRLDDQLLMGHVLAERYLHPSAYRSRFKELRRWTLSYSDHPQAERIYKLAKKRQPSNGLNPKRPSGGYLSGSGFDATGFASKVYSPSKRLNRADVKKARSYKRKMRYYTRKGWTKSVKRLLHTQDVQRVLHQGQLDRARTWLAAGYYADGRDEWAYDWASKAIERSGRYLPTAHWVAALASWRLGKLEQAGEHFKSVTRSEYSSGWMTSAGAYWAARSALLLRKPNEVNEWLSVAAASPRTFYGQLAVRALGYKHAFDWSVEPLDKLNTLSLKMNDPARRALALLQVEKDDMAEEEFRKAYAQLDESGHKAMLGVAMRSNMPSFTMRLANVLNRKGIEIPDAALYPLPKWEPKNGFQVDRALVFAIMRQESGFNPMAQSHAGARGLMQLMPGTASFVARDRTMRWSKTIYEPEVNIHLGQTYVQMLLAEQAINGDLFHMMAAWNAGPGNLNKWKRTVKHHGDPLLFIESLPSKETRIFIERVLTNFWVYRDRLGQPSQTLDAVAQGKWPSYTQIDKAGLEVARAGKNQ